MNRPPTPGDIRDRVRPLDEVDRKVLGGLIAVMIAEPSRIRDQEWMAEQFVRLAVVAHADADEPAAAASPQATPADVTRIQAYARARQAELFATAIELFVRVAEDLRGHPDYTFEDARARVTDYLAS